MIDLQTIRELARYNDWANEQILTRCVGLTDEALDRAFEMGVGSLRRTLLHIYNGEHVWLQRWKGRTETGWPSEDERISLQTLDERFRRTWNERDEFLRSLSADAPNRVQIYRDSMGGLFQAALGDMMLQLCVHSMHHRAQALNMLRHVGAELPKPGLDYVFMRLQNPNDPPPTFALGAIRHYYACGDKAQDRMMTAAAALDDERLDRPFEMGVGSLRKTLLHIRFAEQWWLDNWTLGPGRPFPELPESMPVSELRGLFNTTASKRNSFLANLNDADLHSPVEAHPRPNVKRVFPLGVTLLQLCGHGVHHRAQAVNMLRRLGAEPLELDYMMSVRSSVAPVSNSPLASRRGDR